MAWLINAAQLDKFRKSQKNVTILDASWHLPAENRDAKQEFLASHVIGARFLDLNLFHDPATALPHMLTRDEKVISEHVGELGITNEHKIIFYDKSALHTSCRALWMFKVFGHNPNQLYILDGGYAAWEKYGGKAETGEPRSIHPKPYAVTYEAHFIRSLMQMKMNLHHPTEQVIDVRHPVRYAGGPEFRPGLRRGHIPNSFSFPYITLFEADGRFKPLEKIRKQLTGIGILLDRSIITTCGSGITSAILNFILDLLNHSAHSLYDGSWTEWSSTHLYPGEATLDERPVKTSLDDQ
jgi:thiosulfate/3-mercaptopyruvate sulfurtransferase